MVEEKYIAPINIWDDYHEDGYVPDGKIQETYLYVEDSNMSLRNQLITLNLLLSYMEKKLDLEGVETSLYLYDSWKLYPELIGGEYEFMLFKRYQINFKHLTHKRKDQLVEELNNSKHPIRVYSES